jgi:hypothetical protein
VLKKYSPWKFLPPPPPLVRLHTHTHTRENFDFGALVTSDLTPPLPRVTMFTLPSFKCWHVMLTSWGVCRSTDMLTHWWHWWQHASRDSDMKTWQKEAAPVYHFSHLLCKSSTKLDSGSHECAKEHCSWTAPSNYDKTDFRFEFRVKSCTSLQISTKLIFWTEPIKKSNFPPKITLTQNFPTSKWCVTRPNGEKAVFRTVSQKISGLTPKI